MLKNVEVKRACVKYAGKRFPAGPETVKITPRKRKSGLRACLKKAKKSIFPLGSGDPGRPNPRAPGLLANVSVGGAILAVKYGEIRPFEISL